jgi:hypothetical protein
MMFVYGYLFVAFLILCFCIVKTFSPARPDILRDMHRHVGDKTSWWFNLVCYVVLIFFWPIVFAYLLVDKLFNRVPSVEEDEPFAVKPTEIIAYLTQEAIEENAMVEDPLDAVPRVAFGHLNSAWLNFIAQCQPDDQLARFAATRKDWGTDVHYVGVVCVRAGVPIHYFLTGIR